MKIAVLFGSFNPLTNSHISVLKSAIENVGADFGLLVATNGQYLKKKTTKHNDAFYLTEEERREISEKVCASEPKLRFFDFELGGVNPKRYKTLIKIRKQYPDAELYEVQGADKIRSISKFGDSEEYVNNIHFAVFGRDGIDIEAMIDSDPLLSAHRDHFIVLPPLAEGAEISSTEVRRRFYAGEDYTDIIPEPAVEVLQRYKPSDFTISFADRVQILLKNGRFGVNAAQKLVYTENNKLFKAWRDGNAEINFGDYHAFLDNAKLYKTAFDVSDQGTIFPTTETGCINIDCVDLAEILISRGFNPAILNLASAKRCCGAYDLGLSAQEESLCRSSNLSLSLYQYSDNRYKSVRESGVAVKEVGYPLDLNYGGIYTPDVTFFRHGKSRLYELRDNPFRCDVITVAGLSFNGRSDFAYADEMSYRSDDGGFTPDGEEIMLNKIRTIYRLAIEHGKTELILGALSCGAYKCPPTEVARQFKTVLEEPEFKNKFRLVTFAILENTRKPNGLDGKFAPFYREFGTYVI